MKRSKALMVSYIIILFVSVFVRLFANFQMWPILVAATTTSSAFISVVDFCTMIVDNYHITARTFLSHSEVDKNNVRKMIISIENTLREKAFSPAEIKAHTEEGCLNYYTTTLENIKKMLQQYSDIENVMRRHERTAKTLEKVSIVISAIGFLAFFSIILFKPVSLFVISHQDIFTVSSFGIILLTQYLEDLFSERSNLLQQDTDEISNGLKILRESFERGVG